MIFQKPKNQKMDIIYTHTHSLSHTHFLIKNKFNKDIE